MDPVKELALEHAIATVGRQCSDVGLILLTAAQYEAYLRGASAKDAYITEANEKDG